MSWQHPFPKNTISSVFGTMRNRKTPHRGTDYAPGAKKLIPAVTDGECVDVRWSDCLGWVMIQKASTNKHYIGYCHLSCSKHGIDCKGPSQHPDGSTCMVKLKPGDKLKMGDPAGRVGNTGRCSRGAHLHITLGTTISSPFRGRVYNIAKFIDKNIRAEENRASESIRRCPCCKQKL